MIKAKPIKEKIVQIVGDSKNPLLLGEKGTIFFKQQGLRPDGMIFDEMPLHQVDHSEDNLPDGNSEAGENSGADQKKEEKEPVPKKEPVARKAPKKKAEKKED